MARPEPLVSIVVPAYNMADKICDAIDSCLAQTHKNFELIVVDDGSTDGTGAVVAEYTDERIRCIRTENAGLSAARNRGIAEAMGRYLCLLDADDRIAPDKLWRQVDFMEIHAAVTMVTGNSVRTDEQWRVLYRIRYRAGRIDAADMFYRNPFPIHAALFRRGAMLIVGDFETSLKGGEDWDYYCRLLLRGGIIAHDPTHVCDYRMLRDGMSNAAERQTKALLQVISRTFNHGNMPISLTPIRPLAEADVYLSGATKAYASGQIELGRDYLQRAVERDDSLSQKNGGRIVNRFVYYSRALDESERRAFLDSVISSSQEIVPGIGRWSRSISFLLKKEAMHLQLDRGERAEATRTFTGLVLRHPLRSLTQLRSWRRA